MKTTLWLSGAGATALAIFFAQPVLAAPGDDDDDGVLNLVDNCFAYANADQQDSDEDGYGNACDADFDNDGVVNAADLGILRLAFFSSGDVEADLNGDGVVNFGDLGRMRTLFFAAPGPSAMAPVAPDIGPVIDMIASLPEGEWYLASTNLYSDAWAPADLRPLMGNSNPSPDVIIAAWSSFGWDRNRGQIILYGGGHASYSGNDTYTWKATTGEWERASLPSEITLNTLGEWETIDGPDNAPQSAHTYDNAVFLPRLDRYLNFGGALYNSAGPYIRVDEFGNFERTGPYLFDPSKANGDMVGGITGSHVQRVAPFPEIEGGQMWENRDMYANAITTGPLPNNFVQGLNGYALEDGKDVVYFGARLGGNTSLSVWRYVFNSIDDPTQDTVDFVGAFNSGPASRGAGAYDPQRQVFVRTGSSNVPFAYWDMTTPGPGNPDVRVFPIDTTGEFVMNADFGIDYDPIRKHFLLWDGGPEVWILTPPETISAEGWLISRQPDPTLVAPTNNVPVQNGVLGKWKYAANLDVFVGLRDRSEGNVWFYKPVGWVAPPRGTPPAP